MPQTTMCANLLQPLEILTQLGIDAVGEDLGVFAIDNVLLPVQEPGGDLELGGVLDDGDDSLQFVRVEVASTLVEIDIGLLAYQVGIPPAHTFDFGQGIHDFSLSVDIGVEETKNVLELLVRLGKYERHGCLGHAV